MSTFTVRFTYDIVTDESAAHGDAAERGWYDIGGYLSPVDERPAATALDYAGDADECADFREEYPALSHLSDSEINAARDLAALISDIPHDSAEPNAGHCVSDTIYLCPGSIGSSFFNGQWIEGLTCEGIAGYGAHVDGPDPAAIDRVIRAALAIR